ncbi:MAG: YhcH/YjgK/YiaL family protein [Candidatus Azobacteroides sp.]|nr:YhcH/YjgK/YiaL family protein [Candidatus Azobacteroides sp.]
MIVDALSNSGAVEKLHPLFKKAFDFLKSTDFSKAKPGKIAPDGDNLFVSVVETQGKTKEEAKLETHNRYIDIQMPVIGTETMGWLAGKDCKNPAEPYNAEKDITFFTDEPSTYIHVKPFEFAIFFPEDGHAPAIADGMIKKVIIKVKV